MLLLRVDENEEFAPIKDFTGIYNPDTAKKNTKNIGIKLRYKFIRRNVPYTFFLYY